MSNLLSLDKLSKYFLREDGTKFAALNDLNLQIDEQHHLISLIGPDGSGKSTLLKIVAGILAPEEGAITLNLKEDSSQSLIGYMSQNLGLYEDLSVGTNLKLFAKLRDLKYAQLQDDKAAQDAAHKVALELQHLKEHSAQDLNNNANSSTSLLAKGKTLLAKLGLGFSDDPSVKAQQYDDAVHEAALDGYLDDLITQAGLIKFKDFKAGSLSGGMKQKLALTCAISAKPKLLILDEPTVGVDPISRRELWAIIEEYLKKTNSYCLFSSLYLEEAERGSLTIFINQGKLIFSGSAQKLREDVQSQCFAMTLDSKLSYQKIARALMCQLHHSSCIMDLCPRMGRIDFLVHQGKSLENLSEDLTKLFKLINEQNEEDKVSSSDYQLSKREAILQDAYINLTYHNSDHSGTDDSKSTSVNSKHAHDPNDPHFAPDESHTEYLDDDVIYETDEQGRRVVISVDGIRKEFGAFTAVHDSNFKVYQGEIFGLLGPNGAGKTTTFRMICSLLNPTAGTILINNIELKYAKSSVRATIGYVAQKFCLYRKLTAKQNLEYFGQSYGLEGEVLQERIASVSKIFNITSFLGEISDNLPFGIQRSLSMACALIHRPTILFLDEATSGADPTSRRAFWSMISKLAAQGTTIIVTTHFMEEAEYCDRFLIQDQGTILILGTPDEICNHGDKRISIEEAFISCVNERRAKSKEAASDKSSVKSAADDTVGGKHD